MPLALNTGTLQGILGKGQHREGSAGQIFSALSMEWSKCRLVDEPRTDYR
jgi:hypothetical protein